MTFTAAILAAGNSSRLGAPKQLLRFQGQTLIRRTTRTVLNAQIARVTVILGNQSELIAAELDGLPVEILLNENWREGMASSVRLATQNAGEADALLLTPCDLPLLSSAHLRDLIQKWETERAPIVASRYDEILGAPLIIERALWPELLELRDDVGARRVIARHAASWVDWPDGAFDVDTSEDWANFKAQ